MGRKAATPPPTGPTPGDVLRAVIAEREPGVTTVELAKRTGMTRANVSRVLSGAAPYPSVQTVELLLSAVRATLCHYHRAKARLRSIEIDTDSS